MEKKKFTGWKQLSDLKSEYGTICAWFIDDTTANIHVKQFETLERARTYASLYNDMLASIDQKPVQWTFGTLAEMEAAKIEAVKAAADIERAKYAEYVEARVRSLDKVIKALEQLADVCRDFDGKVINKRFHDRVKAATGLTSYFDKYRGLILASFAPGRPVELNIYADFSKSDSVSPDVWQWGTNDRLETDKAVYVIERAVNHRNGHRAQLLASIDHFTEYVELARRLAKEIDDMKAADYDMRDYVRKNVLGPVQASTVFHTY